MTNNKIKILAIDDNTDNLIVLKALINDLFPNAQYFSADSGKNGIDKCQSEKPDVVLLDIVMPGMDGYEVCKNIKSDIRLRHIPVIMVTANQSDKESRVKALEAGADAFLQKPVDESELKAQIKAMLRIKEAEDLKKAEKQHLEDMVLDRTEELEIELADRIKAENKLIQSLDKITENRQAIMNLMEDLKGEMNERRKAEENTNLKNKELLCLNSLATDLSGMSNTENIAAFLMKRLKEFTGSELLVFSEYDSDNQILITRHVEADQKILKKLISIAGDKIINSPAPIRMVGENFKEIITEIVSEKKSLTDLSFGAISSLVDKAFGSFTGFEKYFGLSFVVASELYGTSFISFKKGQTTPSTDFLKSFSHIAAISLQRRKTEEKLKKSETGYRMLIENQGEGVGIVDLSEKFVFVNPAAEEMFGVERGGLLNQNLMGFIVKEQRTRIEQETKNRAKSEKATYEIDIVRSTGDKRTLLITATPQFNSEGILTGTFDVFRDISERKKAERTLHDIIDNNPMSIQILDLEGCTLKVNKAFIKLFGSVPPPDYSIFNDFQLKEKGFADLIERIKNSEVVQFPDMVFNPHDSLPGMPDCLSWIKAIGFALTDSNGKPEKIVLMHENITERKLAEEKLSQSYAFNDSLLKTIPFGMDIVDEDGNVMFLSDNFKKILGGENIGKKCWELYRDDKKQCSECPLFKGIVIGETEAYESHGVLDNRIFEISHTGMLYQGKKAMLEIFMDITERKQTEVELIKAKEKAEEGDRLKTAFLHNISHEIRTPMNAIVGFSALLGEPDLDAQSQKDYVEVITQSSNHLLAIITDIIDISNIEANIVKIVKNEINLNSTLKSLCDQFLPLISGKNLQLVCESKVPDRGAMIITDSTKLGQIITNLLSNAIKFTDKGSIKLGCEVKGEFLEFRVSDSGIGISAEHHGKIFDRFYQVQHAVSRLYEGTGLGLAISKANAEHMGGEMWLTSEPGIGTTFFFTIPYEKQVKSDTLIDNQRSTAEFVFSEKKTILIAEDIDSNFKLVRYFLSGANVEIIHAVNGKEAVEKCLSNKNIDLILMDIKMPVMDGYTAAKLIRETNPLIPIIAQTAYADDIEKAIESGCSGLISKPFDKKGLLNKISKFIK